MQKIVGQIDSIIKENSFYLSHVNGIGETYVHFIISVFVQPIVIASVLNITYQNIEKQLLKEVLGGVSGLYAKCFLCAFFYITKK